MDRPESKRARENKVLTERIRRSHQQSHEIYGSTKIHKDLVAEGEACGVNRVAHLMKFADIKSKMTRKFVVTTDPKNTMQPAPDLLKRRFTVDKHD